ncbi:MAG: hypothetical protein E7620_02110 [Ruminococcaceae bacterium]|nr:hypothetical protein [Oscillospiraceae bacterium]
MSWLAPLGFLGLLGVVALIVIYIIKPNYQNKMISSTFIWRLSLKYRKKRLPINRLNNFLLFLCQLLILTICGTLLAQPVLESELVGDENERVIILDASASMRLSNNAATRFERAVADAKAMVDETAARGGMISVIYADANPRFLTQRAGAVQVDEIHAALDALVSNGIQCSYASADLKGAVALAEEVLLYNSEAQVHLITATDYLEHNGIQVKNIADPAEWNVAVMNCTAELDRSNHYEISVDVGCFGRTEMVTVYCEIHGANGNTSKTEPLMKTESFDPSEEQKTVVFTSDDMGNEPLYSFDYLEVYVSVADSFVDDNSFFLYGGKKQTIKIQYASSVPNNYFGGVVRSLRQNMRNQWDIRFTELKADEKAATEGFDLYIFEHRMPKELPTDGVVLLVDPVSAPEGSGLNIGKTMGVDKTSTLASGQSNELMQFVDTNRITIAKYNEILSHDGYEELAYYNGSPVVLAKNFADAKVVVWAFDLNYSNLCALPDFAFMMYNLFNHYVPATMGSQAFEIGETVELQARGTELTVSGNGEDVIFEGNQGTLTLSRPGTYTVTQKPMAGEHLIIENFFVKIPSAESNVTKQVEALPVIDVDTEVETAYEDLLFYFAIFLVALMFLEWMLQTKKNY